MKTVYTAPAGYTLVSSRVLTMLENMVSLSLLGHPDGGLRNSAEAPAQEGVPEGHVLVSTRVLEMLENVLNQL